MENRREKNKEKPLQININNFLKLSYQTFVHNSKTDALL